MDIEYGKIVNKAFIRRTKGDYNAYVEFEEGVVEDMLEDMKAFIVVIKEILDHSE